jgi:AraC family ethanolamine operon transcriptional activator
MAARELVSHPMNHAMTVDDLCAQLHVTRRTLQNHFQRVVGESPADFLKAVRLNACRRRLREARAGAALTVQGVAAQWGFFHMGHFSADYKAMFGELPSKTLRGAQLQPLGATQKSYEAVMPIVRGRR